MVCKLVLEQESDWLKRGSEKALHSGKKRGDLVLKVLECEEDSSTS